MGEILPCGELQKSCCWFLRTPQSHSVFQESFCVGTQDAFRVCGCVCISLMAHSLIWLTCAKNFLKLVFMSDYFSACQRNSSSSSRSRQSSCLAALGRALMGKRSFFACGYIKRLEEETIPPSFEVILPARIWSFTQTGGVFALWWLWVWFSDPVCSFEAPIRLYSAEKRSHVSVVKPASFFLGGKDKIGFWNISYAKRVTFSFAVYKCNTLFFRTALVITRHSNRHKSPY